MSEPTTTAAIAAPAKKPESVKEYLALPAYAKRFEEVLGKRAPQFMASITNAVSQSSALAHCEPRSVIAAAFVAATLDLPIDRNLGFAWVIPYRDKAQFQMGWRGFVQLALRSGQYERLNAKAINAEAFAGFDGVGEPIIKWELVDEAKEIVGYAVAWRLTTGFVKTAFWSKAKVEEHAQRYSQAYRAKKKDSPWFTHFDLMARKTVLANELKAWGILSIDLQRAVEHDQGSQQDIGGEIKHDDGALFDMGGSITEALTDEPGAAKPAAVELVDGAAKADTTKAADQKTSPATPPSTEKAKLVEQLESLALDLGFNHKKLAAIAGAQETKQLKEFTVDQLNKALAYAKDANQLRQET